MKLVKEKSTNNYMSIDQATYDADPSLYIDRSDRPVYWLNHYEKAGISYYQSRFHIKELVDNAVNNIDDFNEADKDAIIEYSYGDRNKMITHLVTVHGYTVNDAKGKVALNAANNQAKLAVCAKIISSSPKIMSIGTKYLGFIDGNGNYDTSQAFALTSAISDFMTEFERFARLGLNYGDEAEGIMDYFESTNSYAEGGLKNYTFNPDIVSELGSEDNARLAMVAELKDLFLKGNV